MVRAFGGGNWVESWVSLEEALLIDRASIGVLRRCNRGKMKRMRTK